MYRHIAVAVDGSRTARTALRHACGLAVLNGAALTLIHVANPAEYMATMAPEFMQYEGYEAEATTQGNKILAEAVVQAKTVLGADAPLHEHLIVINRNTREMAKGLADYAFGQGCDLLVIGTHGRSGLMHLLIGSFAETVMRETRLPLLVIRRDEGDEGGNN